MFYTFDSNIAKKYGVNEAIFLSNLQFWILKNKVNNANFYDNHYWTYNSYEAFSQLFPFWNKTQIKHIVKKLEDKKVIISGNYNKSPYDKTKWYAFVDEYAWLDAQINQAEEIKLSDRKEKNVQPIPDIKPNLKPDLKEIYKEKKQTSNSSFGCKTITENEEQKNRNQELNLFQESNTPLENNNTDNARQEVEYNKTGILSSTNTEKRFMGYTDEELIKKTIFNWNNAIAERFVFAKISCINKTRLSKLKARIKQAGGFKEFWEILNSAIETSNFLRIGNETWKCNFDFVLQESSFLKIMEKQYK